MTDKKGGNVNYKGLVAAKKERPSEKKNAAGLILPNLA